MSTPPVAWTNHQHLAPTEDVASWTLVDVARLTDSLFAICSAYYCTLWLADPKACLNGIPAVATRPPAGADPLGS